MTQNAAPRAKTVALPAAHGTPPSLPVAPPRPVGPPRSVDGAAYCKQPHAKTRSLRITGAWEPQHLACLERHPPRGRVSIENVEAHVVDAVLDHGRDITELTVRLTSREQIRRVGRLTQLSSLDIDLHRRMGKAPQTFGVEEAVSTVDDFRELSRLRGLQRLELNLLRVTDDKLAALAGLQALESLRFYGVGLTSSSLRHLAGMQRLRELRIGRFSLRDSFDAYDDEALERLSGLPRLELPALAIDGELTNRGLARLVRMARWTDLDLSSTKVTDLAPLAHWTQLERLNLASTPIPKGALSHLPRLEHLKALTLAHTSLDGSDLRHLAKAPKIEELDLSHTHVDNASMEHVSALASLQQLDLSHTTVSDDGVARLVSLHQLQTLDLDGTALTDQGMQRLSVLSRLQSLSLAHTHVSQAGLSSLSQLNQLRRLDLRAVSITAGLAALPASLQFVNLRDNPKLAASSLRGVPLRRGWLLLDARADLEKAAERLRLNRPELKVMLK